MRADRRRLRRMHSPAADRRPESPSTCAPTRSRLRALTLRCRYASCRADLALGATIDRLRTGDIAERTETGLFRIVGRLNRLSKIAGLRITHDALEHALGVRGIDAAVGGNDQKVTAFFTGTDSEANI